MNWWLFGGSFVSASIGVWAVMHLRARYTVAVVGMMTGYHTTLRFVRFRSERQAQAWVDHANANAVPAIKGLARYVVVDRHADVLS